MAATATAEAAAEAAEAAERATGAAAGSERHVYRAYGLTIASALPLPELRSATAARAADVRISPASTISPDVTISPDITISLAALPEFGLRDGPEKAQRIGPFLWATADQFWLCVPGIARYRMTRGQAIVVDPAPTGDADGVRVFLLGTALGVLLAQRGHLMLHGNAIRIGHGCVICVGPSGAGKSTLAAGFGRRGYAVLADDLVMVDDAFRVTPGIPRIKLWADTTRALAIDTAALRRVRPNLEKFSYPLHEGFCDSAAPVRAVYSLGTADADTVSIERLGGFSKITEIRANTYRPRFVAAMALRGRNMALCTGLAAASPVARLARPVLGFTVDRVIDRILEDLGAEETRAEEMKAGELGASG